jgi:hypothetical protein
MYPCAKETEVVLKKELTETKDQVNVLKERAKEVRKGEQRSLWGDSPMLC